MITEELKTLSPHTFATELVRKCTTGIEDHDKFFRISFYLRFIILGGFLKMNNEYFRPGETQDTLALTNYKLTAFVNRLFTRFGPSDMIPGDFHFIRTLWQRRHTATEQSFLDQLSACLPDAGPDTLLEGELLVLGAIEQARMQYYDLYNHRGRDSETARSIQWANYFLQKITGQEIFFTIENVEPIFKFFKK
ncbi:MAG TPA: hypothetical protein VMW76_09695 [Bacteroidales bacterium]|nr:hypothetical protein [Bacteroidales bacterium]